MKLYKACFIFIKFWSNINTKRWSLIATLYHGKDCPLSITQLTKTSWRISTAQSVLVSSSPSWAHPEQASHPSCPSSPPGSPNEIATSPWRAPLWSMGRATESRSSPKWLHMFVRTICYSAPWQCNKLFSSRALSSSVAARNSRKRHWFRE